VTVGDRLLLLADDGGRGVIWSATLGSVPR
jgi:hypothetical protein